MVALRLLGLGALIGALACGTDDPQARARRAERDQLRREVAGFRALEPLARTGLLTDEHEMIVTVSDTLIRGLLAEAFPVVVGLSGGITVHLTGATVSFRANVARVDVVGELRRASFPSVGASIALRGALDAFVVDSTGVLRARLSVDDVLVTEPRHLPGFLDPLAVAVLQRMVEHGAPRLAAALPEVAVPVRFDHELSLPGFAPGRALSVRPTRAPITVTASRVVAFQNRIWIILRIARGEFVTDSAP